MSNNNNNQTSLSEQDFKQAFKAFDLNGDGFITRDEIQRVMKDLNFGEVEVAKMLKEADTNHDGKIDYNEFVKTMNAN